MWQVQVTGAGEEMENILRNKTTSNRVGAPHPRPPGPPTKTFIPRNERANCSLHRTLNA